MADKKKPADKIEERDDEELGAEEEEEEEGVKASSDEDADDEDADDEDADDEDADDEDADDEDADDEDADDEDADDEDADDEDADDEDADDEDEDDEDEDEDEDEEDDEEEEEAGATTRSGRVAESADWLPDWAPWATLGTLLFVGIIGGLGFLPFNFKLDKSAAAAASASATAATTTTTTTTATARRLPPGAGSAGMDQGEQVGAAHVLIAYKGSMRADPKVTRTKEEAKKRAQEVIKKAKAGGDFAKLAAEYSDEPGADKRGGNLGMFTRQRMVKPFADAAFNLKPGQVSDVVETQFGYHVIKRTQ